MYVLFIVYNYNKLFTGFRLHKNVNTTVTFRIQRSKIVQTQILCYNIILIQT